MSFSVSRSIEVLSATPPTLRALLGNLSDEWIRSEGRGDTSEESDSFLTTTPSADHPADEASAPLLKPGGELNPATPPKQGGELNPATPPNREGEPWSPYDIIGHLIHGERTDWIPRARIILEQGGNRTFVPFDRFAQFEDSKGKSLAELLDEFAKLRVENIDTLRSWTLDDEQLDLEDIHPELGRVTLRQLLATWVVHDLNHVRQIVTVMAKRYDGEVGVWKEYLSILKS